MTNRNGSKFYLEAEGPEALIKSGGTARQPAKFKAGFRPWPVVLQTRLKRTKPSA